LDDEGVDQLDEQQQQREGEQAEGDEPADTVTHLLREG
jgi:hypothetical protein